MNEAEKNNQKNHAVNENQKSNHTSWGFGQKIAFQLNEGIHLCPINDIVRIESNHNFVFVHLMNGRSIFLSKSLKEIEGKLPQQQFIRVHNSHIINLNFLTILKKDHNAHAILNGNIKVPVARRRYADLLEKIKEWSLWI